MLRHGLHNASRADIITNILVYIPFGVLLIKSFSTRRCPICTLFIVTLASALLSLSLEYFQAHLPSRVPSVGDLILNTLGGFAGALLALLVRSDALISEHLKSLRATYIQPGPQANLGLAVIGVWALSQLSPLVPSLDLDNLRQGVKPLFHTLQTPATLEWIRVGEYSLAIGALGILSGTLQKIRYHAKLRFAIFAIFILLLKVPVVSRQISLEALTGLFIGLSLIPLFVNIPLRVRLWATGVMVLGAVLTAGLYVPTEVISIPISDSNFNWIPFRGHLSNNIIGIVDILSGLWPFLALSYIALLTGCKRRLQIAAAGASLIFFTMFALEWNQQDLPGRSADITDAILPVIAWLFPWITPSFWKNRQTANTQPVTTDSTPSGAVVTHKSLITIGMIVALVVVGIVWQIAYIPYEHGFDEGRQPTLPPPESLPITDIPGFRYIHPRLPVPSPEQIFLINSDNPRYFAKVEKRARNGKGDFRSVILSAYVNPGSQNLDLLHQRLMDLRLSWRGHEQAKPLALAYDWLYDQWTPEQRRQLRGKVIEASNYLIERIRVKQRLSPYNVFLYNSPFQALMATTLATYGDADEAELTMRWTYDYWKNRVLPVWRQVMGQNGGWHEGGEYVGIGIGQAVYQLPAMWRKATGEDLLLTEPGIRGFLDFLIYRTRPDGTHMRWGDGAFFDRRIPDRVPLAIEYADSAAYSLKGCPKPYRPTSWPWGPLTTDTLCDKEAINILPLQKRFDGIGMIIARSGWDKKATYLTFKAGDNYWSHSHLDQGAFTLFKGGPLAIDSGLYGPRYGSDHHMNYSYQTIAHNVITVTDPDDNIPAPSKKKNDPPRQIANDGGQRRVGSGWGSESAPLDLDEWLQKQEIYHTGKIEKYYDRDDLVIAVADITPAYTNKYSGRGRFSDRTRRVEKYWRTIVYDRANDAVIIYDDLVATDPSFRKRSLVHTIDEPFRTRNGFTTQVPASKHPSRETGRLEATILFPEIANISLIGGKGKEFLVDGVNFNEEGRIWQKVEKRKKNRPEPGLWRVEISPSIMQKRDRFLMVLKPTIGIQGTDLRIRRLVTEQGIGCEITGPARTLELLFPDNREGVIVGLRDEMGRRKLDLTLASPEYAKNKGILPW